MSVFQRGKITPAATPTSTTGTAVSKRNRYATGGASSAAGTVGSSGGSGVGKRGTAGTVALGVARDDGSFNGVETGSTALSQLLAELFKQAYLRLCFSLRKLMPCQVSSPLTLSYNITDARL